MLPYIKIGQFSFSSYGLTMLIGLIAVLILLRFQSKRFNFPYRQLYTITIYTGLLGIIGANIFHIFLSYKNMTIREGLDFVNGHMFYGFFFGALLAVFLLTRIYKINFLTTLNVCIPAWVVAQAVGRLACFFAGCCYGKSCDLPWSMTFTHRQSFAPIGTPLHPTQLYEAIALFMIVILLFMLQNQRFFKDRLIFIYVFLYATSRFFVEFFRGDHKETFFNAFSTSQTISLFIIFSLVLSSIIFRKSIFNPFSTND